MDIIIQRASANDAQELIEYLKQVGGETDNLTFGAEGIPITVEDEKKFLSQQEFSKDNIIVVAKENGKIVGNASLNRQPRRMNHRAGLAVSVLKDYWNKGIGSQLMEKIIQFAKNNKISIIDLEVRQDNLSAITLYKKYGFYKIGTHPSFLKINDKPVPCDYMCLEIM